MHISVASDHKHCSLYDCAWREFSYKPRQIPTRDAYFLETKPHGALKVKYLLLARHVLSRQHFVLKQRVHFRFLSQEKVPEATCLSSSYLFVAIYWCKASSFASDLGGRDFHLRHFTKKTIYESMHLDASRGLRSSTLSSFIRIRGKHGLTPFWGLGYHLKRQVAINEFSANHYVEIFHMILELVHLMNTAEPAKMRRAMSAANSAPIFLSQVLKQTKRPNSKCTYASRIRVHRIPLGFEVDACYCTCCWFIKKMVFITVNGSAIGFRVERLWIQVLPFGL